jgi:beta-lactamase class A
MKHFSVTTNNKDIKAKRTITFAWGVATLFFVLTLCLYGGLLQPHRQSVRVLDSSFINPATSLVKKENLIVNFQELRELLQSKYEQRRDYVISIYFEYLPTGANISTHKDEKIWPASLIKIPVAMAAMKKVQDGKWKLTNELVILDEDKDSEYGELYKKPTGTTISIEELLRESLVNSDNTAHFVLLRNIENEELEDVYNHLGLDDIIETLKRSKKDDAEDNRMTAKRYAIFFRSLYNATFLDAEYSQMFLDILEHAPKDLLAQGMPKDVVFVHKTGVRTDEAVRADSGIVYVSGRPYLVTVMIQKKDKKAFDEEEVGQIFKDIGNDIYTYVTSIR